MIVRRLDGLTADRWVVAPNWTSRRLLLRRDGMGFSMHDTILHPGTSTRMCYTHHLEAVYCIEGEGDLTDLASGTVHPLAPGTLYALDRHDDHVLTARTRLRMICVFNPGLVGPENHDARGAYPLLDDAGLRADRS